MVATSSWKQHDFLSTFFGSFTSPGFALVYEKILINTIIHSKTTTYSQLTQGRYAACHSHQITEKLRTSFEKRERIAHPDHNCLKLHPRKFQNHYLEQNQHNKPIRQYKLHVRVWIAYHWTKLIARLVYETMLSCHQVQGLEQKKVVEVKTQLCWCWYPRGWWGNWNEKTWERATEES